MNLWDIITSMKEKHQLLICCLFKLTRTRFLSRPISFISKSNTNTMAALPVTIFAIIKEHLYRCPYRKNNMTLSMLSRVPAGNCLTGTKSVPVSALTWSGESYTRPIDPVCSGLQDG